MPISRTSEAIFQRLSAIVRSPPWAAITASSVAWAWKWLADSRTSRPVRPASRAAVLGGVLRVGVDPGPDRGPAERDRQQLGLGGARPTDRLLQLAGVAPELLAESDRRGVLEVGPAGLDDRPQLLSAFASSAARSVSSAGRSSSSIAIAAASCIAVGIVSFEDWHLLTSSFGWTRRPPPSRSEASCATTSFMFVFVDVPEPVW